MEKWILVVRSNVKEQLPGAEFNDDDKFNDLYDNIHAPDALETYGFVSCRRFVSPDFNTKEAGKYLAIYEIETDDIGKSMTSLQEVLRKRAKQGRVSEIIEVVSVALYRQITSLTK